MLSFDCNDINFQILKSLTLLVSNLQGRPLCMHVISLTIRNYRNAADTTLPLLIPD